MASRRRLDLAELHAEAPDLDLEVAATQELDVAVRQVARQVPGLVQRAPGPEGVGHEALRGEFGALQVAPAHLDPTDVQLADLPDGNRSHVRVEDVQLRVGDGLADGHERQWTVRVADPDAARRWPPSARRGCAARHRGVRRSGPAGPVTGPRRRR